ncbi:MAG: AAA family ATPase, partial [Spirochaetaceae bacterium]|nr:AAA family ATPase [Spirochaetaceae bacterium]
MMEGSEVTTTISSFGELRGKGALYVDKTAYLHSLVRQEGNRFFLSRPRRFGKTLTVSTLEAIFQGKRELFKGLAIDALDYDWKTYPIIHIDFGDCPFDTPKELDSWLCDLVLRIAKGNGVVVEGMRNSAVLFANLLEALSSREGKVVVLVDEYDKAVSDNVFSDHVEELRTVLGYTQKELETNFAGYIDQGVKDTGMGREAYLAKVREMYDGYRFAPGSETVYSPVSVGSFFDGSDGGGVRFNDYWIDTGSSKLVMDMAQSVDLDVTEDLEEGMGADALSSFDVAELSHAMGDMGKVQAFLLQTGYLTMDGYDEELGVYYLRFPNKEVQEAYYRNLLTRWCSRESGVVIRNLVVSLRKGDTQGYMGTLAAVFASVPYRAGKKEPDFAQVVDVVMLLCGKAV